MTYPWMYGAAAVTPSGPDDEGGPLYPPYGTGNTAQVSQSFYYGRDFERSSGYEQNNRRDITAAQASTEVDLARTISDLVHYFMVKMEPTDRCLRPPGDIFDPKRIGPDGLEIYGDRTNG